MCALDSGNSIDKANLYSQIVIALANLTLATYAIFGETIRRYKRRPKIVAEVKENFPYIEELKENRKDETSDTENLVDIRIKIENNGKYPAANLRGICDRIYKQRDSNKKYIQEKIFLPQQFFFLDGNQVQDILSNFPYYVNIAKISKQQSNAENVQSNSISEKGNDILFLLVENQSQKGSYQSLGKGRFIIPVYIHYNDAKTPLSFFLEIYWSGNSI